MTSGTYKGLQRNIIALTSSMYLIWPFNKIFLAPWLPRLSKPLLVLGRSSKFNEEWWSFALISSNSNITECKYITWKYNIYKHVCVSYSRTFVRSIQTTIKNNLLIRETLLFQSTKQFILLTFPHVNEIPFGLLNLNISVTCLFKMDVVPPHVWSNLSPAPSIRMSLFITTPNGKRRKKNVQDIGGSSRFNGVFILLLLAIWFPM